MSEHSTMRRKGAEGPDGPEPSRVEGGPIADALVLVSSPGVSPADWQGRGVLDREWAIYSRVGRRFERVVVVTDRAVGDRERLESSLTRATGALVEVIDNPDAAERSAWLAWVAPTALRRLHGAGSALIKTNQHTSADAALVLTHALRGAGVHVGLMARGGYPWSRFEAELHGSSSAPAGEAACREGELCRAASVVVGSTEAMVRDLSWRYGLPTERCRVIPNYVAPPVSGGAAPERDAKELLYVGQLTARKRVELLIDAAALLAGDWETTIRLRIVGEGEARAALERRAQELAVDAVFEGAVPHARVWELLGRCGLYGQMSSLEGHPKTLMEAMAAGAAVIVADAPGLKEFVSHGVTGMCVAPEAREVAHSIAALLADGSWREAMGRAASDWANATLGLDRVAALELAAYTAAMTGAEGAPAESAWPVRWTPAMLREPVSRAVEAWSRSLHGFARRLCEHDRGEFYRQLRNARPELDAAQPVAPATHEPARAA